MTSQDFQATCYIDLGRCSVNTEQAFAQSFGIILEPSRSKVDSPFDNTHIGVKSARQAGLPGMHKGMQQMGYAWPTKPDRDHISGM